MKLATVKSGPHEGEIVSIVNDYGDNTFLCELPLVEIKGEDLRFWKSVNSVKVNLDGTIETT